MPGCSFCNGAMTANQEKTSSGLYGKPVCAKDECVAKAKKEADEAAYFLTVCKARNLNPFLNEVYLIKYSETEPASIVTRKATFAKRADLQPDYEGIQSGIIVQTKDGKLERREGTFYLKDETLLGGWARIFRKGRKEYYEEVALSEYIQRKKDGQPSRFWATMPGTMIKKVAEVHGWRAAFPQEFAGLYDESEVQEVSA